MGSGFWQGVWIGLSIAAPVGPIGVLVIQRTLRHGSAVGLATGLGAAVADALYGAVGAFGVTALVAALQGLRLPLVLGGCAYLLWLAWRTLKAPLAAADAAPAAAPGLWASWASTLVLTLSNPSTVLSFLAIFGTLAGHGATQGPGVVSPLRLVAGVLAGSALWWLLLSAVVGRLRRQVGAQAQRVVAWVSALMLAVFALWQLVTLALTAGVA